MRKELERLFQDIEPVRKPGVMRLTTILDNQATVAKLNPNTWRHRIPFSIKRKVYQANACAICGGRTAGKNLSMDHCHDTGVVRGVLCSSCNMGLGQFKDSPELLRKAAAYIEKHAPEVEL